MVSNNNRDINIDLIRALGLLCIIFVHTNDRPEFLTQFRCFDVPMMVFISGLTFAHKKIGNYWDFISKRTKRLVFPVWIFLTVYFIIVHFLAKTGLIFPFSINAMLESYLLLDGIGYVWIIRVFLIVMLVTPFLLYLSRKIRSVFSFIILIFSLGILHEGMIYLSSIIPDNIFKIIYDNTVLYCSYFILFLLGLRVNETKENTEQRRILLTFSFITVFGALLYYLSEHGFPIIITPEYKYPPQSYFIIWGAFMSYACWLSAPFLKKAMGHSFFVFFGQNTIWIYLWHIPLVSFFNKNNYPWWSNWVLTTGVSAGIYYLQYSLSYRMEQHFPSQGWIKYFRG